MNKYDTLNKEQREAVYHTQGPLLVLAGAGSGKTRVLTHRIAYLIEEEKVNPYNILAITFTNKAAAEMRERVDKIVGFGSESVWVSTFHSTCVRILRRHIDRIGYDNHFTIYDTDDQKTMMKEICKKLDIDTKKLKERRILSAISSAKNDVITPLEYQDQNCHDYEKRKIGAAYEEYEKQLRINNALDFDDLLLKAVQLLRKDEEVLNYYQDRFQYIMVDEYQDTNTVQFKLISLLAAKHKNLCVVGDDDQSIYKFRGADITNILNFEKVFAGARLIKLEQNYRSTSTILDAANGVISNNVGRKDKSLWSDKGEGEPLIFQSLETGYDEAAYVAREVRRLVEEGKASYSDCAVLYRTNAQSRAFEEKLILSNVPYKVVGGQNFYARKEIKDLLSYFKVMNNSKDDLAVRRIINVPTRGIGLTTVNKVQEIANDRGVDFYDVLDTIMISGLTPRAIGNITAFTDLMNKFKADLLTESLTEVMKKIIIETGYADKLKEEGEIESQARLENIDELISKVQSYEDSCVDEKPSLNGFLEEVSLVADVTEEEENTDYMVLMTLHSAKGLEFPHVFLVGMEDGVFPSYMCITSDDSSELEEERRLCYVGITRAMDTLSIICAQRRMTRGETQYNKPSRFLKEIPPHLFGKGEAHITDRLKNKTSEVQNEAKESFKKKSYYQLQPKQQFNVASSDGPGYDVGDRVSHVKFGEGLVTAITAGGRDYEVTVDFDNYGVKKLFSMFAKLQKL